MKKLRTVISISLALLLASPSYAQATANFHLVVAFSEGGTSIASYPSLQRCLRAKSVIDEDYAEKMRQAYKSLPNGGVIVKQGYHFLAICIPG